MAVAAMAVASGMWHAAGRAARVATDGQVTRLVWLPSRAGVLSPGVPKERGHTHT